jgi:acyl-CoA reductase-like NAD-dependent aldehyde dehydrogenase
MTFIPHVIDGQESESASGARFASVDPWTREPYAEVALGGAEDAGRWVVLPTVVENAPPAARICREEVFGPVVTIAPSTMTRTPSVRPTTPATA